MTHPTGKLKRDDGIGKVGLTSPRYNHSKFRLYNVYKIQQNLNLYLVFF